MAHKIKVVFDTNVYISAIIFGGNPRQCLELARGKEIELFSSRPILLELAQKLQKKFKWDKEEIGDLIQGLGVFLKLVKPKMKINLIEDKPDNHILEAALEVSAGYIISGDKKHLLSLKKVKNIQIVSSKEFLDLFFRKN